MNTVTCAFNQDILNWKGCKRIRQLDNCKIFEFLSWHGGFLSQGRVSRSRSKPRDAIIMVEELRITEGWLWSQLQLESCWLYWTHLLCTHRSFAFFNTINKRQLVLNLHIQFQEWNKLLTKWSFQYPGSFCESLRKQSSVDEIQEWFLNMSKCWTF